DVIGADVVAVDSRDDFDRLLAHLGDRERARDRGAYRAAIDDEAARHRAGSQRRLRDPRDPHRGLLPVADDDADPVRRELDPGDARTAGDLLTGLRHGPRLCARARAGAPPRA